MQWKSDQEDGTYINPILFADYSDPDIIKHGDDFYMVASSFNCMPGIPILHSKDLVNWKIINHVYNSLPLEKYNDVCHGEGSWAPSIRFHAGRFYVYFCTPEEGLFMAETTDPKAKWDLHHVVNVRGWEDPCPFWEGDKAYLVHSQLRGSFLYLHEMTLDGKRLLNYGDMIYCGIPRQRTIEGPKFQKRGEYYYILSPAGGVAEGWQTVLRSKDIHGPYDDKIVLKQSFTPINGPHQGGDVILPSGESWFVHFQDKGAYGRIVHLQPMKWVDDWPVLGSDLAQEGEGVPVAQHIKPNTAIKSSVIIPQTSDDFSEPNLGLQWQWQANPRKEWYCLSNQSLILYHCEPKSKDFEIYNEPNLLLQKIASPMCDVTVKMNFVPDDNGVFAGLTLFGNNYSYIVLEQNEGKLRLVVRYFEKHKERGINSESKVCDFICKTIFEQVINTFSIYLRVSIDLDCTYRYFYSTNGKAFIPVSLRMYAAAGKWIGAKIGLFCSSISTPKEAGKGYADFSAFTVE